MRIVLVFLALLPASLGLVACGSSGSSGSINGVQAAWCAFHVWRLESDLRHHHIAFAAFNAALAVHHCRHIRH